MEQRNQNTAWPTGDEQGINPGTKPDVDKDAIAREQNPHNNPDAVKNAQLKPVDSQEGGKEMGLVNAPVTSLHPTSEPQFDKEEGEADYELIDNANFKLNHYLPETGVTEFDYPFEDLEVGQGLFIPSKTTTDALMAKLYKQVDQYRKQNSEIERDEMGDDIMIDLAINRKKRNEDGTVQLDGGVPRLGIASGFTPKLVGPSFVVKAVVKGDEIAEGNEADRDGALVIRMG